jgi:proteasome assembly chaperone (PAC2) family protein
MLNLKVHKIPTFVSQPTMIAALPDMGNVAGMGMNLLATRLAADLFAEIYAFWPPFVTYNQGIVRYVQSSYKFYWVSEYDLVIFTGDFNPSDPRRLYEICYEVLKMAERVDVKILYSIGAALRQNTQNTSTSTSDGVYGAVNNEQIFDMIDKFNMKVLEGEGQIIGFNGLILGLAKERGLNAMCILGEIDNPNVIQPMTAKVILHTLTKILGIPSLDMAELEEEEKRKKFMEQQMNYLENVMEHGGKPPGIA